MITRLEEFVNWLGLRFNVNKCTTLSMSRVQGKHGEAFWSALADWMKLAHSRSSCLASEWSHKEADTHCKPCQGNKLETHKLCAL